MRYNGRIAMRKTKTIASAAIALTFLSIPGTLAQEATDGVTGITLQAVPNAVAIDWQAPSNVRTGHYTVYYSKQSILQNNGRFDGKESTFGDETSLVLLDLKNRGFTDGETMYVTVTATDASGKENSTFAEEQNARVRVPGTTTVQPPHESAPPPETTTSTSAEVPLPPQGGLAGAGELPVPQLLEVPPEISDRTPPEPPSDLLLTKARERDGLYRVEVSWEESLNTAGDLQSYNVYESGDLGKTFLGPTAVRATVLSTTIVHVPPGTLTVKLTAMDRMGNESEGIEETIILPETGPALTLLLSVVGAGVWTARRRKKAS
jgi:hypothetical protein